MSWACCPDLTETIVDSYKDVLPIFASTLQAFMAAQCALVGDHLWPDDAVHQVLLDPHYDFIVVGAGSAGAVVANRLSEVPHWKVLLIEAGGNPTLSTEIPQMLFSNMDSTVDWGYKTMPQERACRSIVDKRCTWLRGKVLGGSSSINDMLYVRANKADYDEWAAEGNKGWNYSEVLPYFFKSENYSEPLIGNLKKYHGNGGYLSVEHKNDEKHNLEEIIIKSATDLGIKYVSDINGDDQMGVTKCATTTKDGIRHSTARAFLNPVKDRLNLHVINNALVTKLLFKPNSSVVNGVLVYKSGKYIKITAFKEVIISAGAINTPQLLMLSGIGPKKHLHKLGISVKADLPVGENLQDQPSVGVYYKHPADSSESSLANITGTLASFMLVKKGSMTTTSPNRVIAFMNTTDFRAHSPDIQLHHTFFPPNVANFVDVYRKQGFTDEFLSKFENMNKNNIMLAVSVTLLKPKSRGKILLKSKNPFEKPLIYPNYFHEPEDLATILKGLKIYAMKLSNTSSLKETGLELTWLELDSCRKYDKYSDNFLRCWASEVTTSSYHQSGTAKMGANNDSSAVVDNELNVKLVDRLRIIDASIIPSAIRGNSNAPTVMIGEKGADMIKTFWLQHLKRSASLRSRNKPCWTGECEFQKVLPGYI